MARNSKRRIVNGFTQVVSAFNCMFLGAVATMFLLAGFPFRAREHYLASLLSEDTDSL